MSGSVLYLIGVVATWVGWAMLGATLYRSIEALAKPKGVARSGKSTAIASAAAVSALAFIVAATLPTSDGKTPGLRLPLTWVVMPFAAWASLGCLCFALYRAYQLAMDSSGDASRGRARQAIFSGILSIAFFAIFRLSGDTITIVQGGVPLTAKSAIAIILLGGATISLMAIGSRAAAARGWGKVVVAHLALLIGSLVFGLPFAWLVITSFKEDQDMSSPNGLVWVPRVSETVPYRDPSDPLYEGAYKGQTVQAAVIERRSDGTVKLDIVRPMVLRGSTFEAPVAQLKEVDRMVPVVTGKYNGQDVTGNVTKELDSGQRQVTITIPASLAGQTFVANPADLQPVRHVGLKWQNYPDSLDYLPPEASRGLTYLRNTLLLVILSVIGTLVSSSVVAYAFSRLKFPGKNTLFTILISTMMLPAAVTLLPTFLIFKSLGLIDTLYPLWVPAFFASAFNVFLLRQFFMTIPKELEDASKIDGCSYFKTFWTIMLPQIKPALAVIAIWTFMGVWNNFQGPLVYINSPENMPISYAVQLYNGQRGGEPGLLMAFATMAMLPVLLLFFVAQKYFIEGVTLSGLGGR